MSLKYGLLGLLSYGDATGYELNKTFQSALSYFWQAQPSQIYRELNQLEEAGCVDSAIHIQQSKPNRRVFTLTDAGKKVLADWLADETKGTDEQLRAPFLVKMFLLGQGTPEGAIDNLHAFAESMTGHLIKVAVVSRGLSGQQGDPDLSADNQHWKMVADFGMSFYKLCADWAHNCANKIEQQLAETASSESLAQASGAHQ